MVVRGTNPLHSEKSMWNLVYPRNPRFLHIHSSASVDLTNHPCSSNPRYSRVNWINDLKSNHVSKSPQPLPWTKPRWEQVQELMLPSSVLTLDGLLSTWWSGRSHGTVSQREDQAPVAHPLHLSIRAIPPCSHTLLHPCLPALPHLATHSRPRAFTLVSSMQDIPFPNIFNPHSLPSPRSLPKGHPLWEQSLNTLFKPATLFFSIALTTIWPTISSFLFA